MTSSSTSQPPTHVARLSQSTPRSRRRPRSAHARGGPTLASCRSEPRRHPRSTCHPHNHGASPSGNLQGHCLDIYSDVRGPKAPCHPNSRSYHVDWIHILAAAKQQRPPLQEAYTTWTLHSRSVASSPKGRRAAEISSAWSSCHCANELRTRAATVPVFGQAMPPPCWGQKSRRLGYPNDTQSGATRELGVTCLFFWPFFTDYYAFHTIANA